MHRITTLKNGLTVISINLPHIDSVTTLVAVGAGSRYEQKKNSGISHFLEHMFFKGSRKYPSTEIIGTMIDNIGAVHNAATSKEYTYYWIKSASQHIELAADILSSQLKEPLMQEEEIEREKGVIVEELRMYRDNPQYYVFSLYEQLQFGNQPLGWDIGGNEETVTSLTRSDFYTYMDSLYSPKNMTLVFVGNLPKGINQLAEKYFGDLPGRGERPFVSFKPLKQTRPKVDVFQKKTDQANLVLGVEGYDRYNPKRYTARLLGLILGEGMSSRLFIQVRERRGLAYHIAAGHDAFQDTGSFAVYGGVKMEKLEECVEVIKTELLKTALEKVSDDELKKAKEMERGRIALRSESTNFLAEHFGVNFVLDREIETFDEYLGKIDHVTSADIQQVAKELFQPNRFNLQVIAPFSGSGRFEKILRS